ncbi:MAG TPA: ABC transporter ATP-binding protein [Candidatus Vogelbacteria bacterium]|nr:ABC transporter ATP-binding protein [Candidatus Vogelbacteria bacterium]
MAVNSIIRLEKVVKKYSLGKIDLTVLKDVDLEIKPEIILSILGPSGSGKSTLLNIISCLDIPTKGKVYLKDQDVSLLTEDELAVIRGKTIGFVFQQFNLLSHLTAVENVSLPAIFQKIPEVECLSRAEKILKDLGLENRVNHRPTELSGGEQQRVAIARALINDPEIVVADEPTGNVDSQTGTKILDIIDELKKKSKTVIIVTHDLNVAKHGDEIVNIKDGQIISHKKK